jgi:hypothetical protein
MMNGEAGFLHSFGASVPEDQLSRVDHEKADIIILDATRINVAPLNQVPGAVVSAGSHAAVAIAADGAGGRGSQWEELRTTRASLV